jgi:hypothetical protein
VTPFELVHPSLDRRTQRLHEVRRIHALNANSALARYLGPGRTFMIPSRAVGISVGFMSWLPGRTRGDLEPPAGSTVAMSRTSGVERRGL